jgi:two-component system, cell cycle sensor histidine kinase and response regulator CckA
MATVLVVDDEPMMRSMMSQILQQEGLSVLTADCAAQALSIFQSHQSRIDLLITDIVMPGMNGMDLATLLQAEYPGLPVLLMSGYCDVQQIGDRFEILEKPFSLSDLITRVRRLMPVQCAA